MARSCARLLSVFTSPTDDDFIDRLTRKYSVIALIFFALIVLFKQVFGTPMVCYTPAQFTSNHVDYATNICWRQIRYPNITDDSVVPGEPVALGYLPAIYKYIPFILIFQVTLCLIPRISWKLFAKFSVLRLPDVLSAASSCCQSDCQPIREKAAIHAANLIGGRKNIITGNYLILVYLASKLQYFLIAIIQLSIIDSVMLKNGRFYGPLALGYMFDVEGEYDFERIPESVTCEFEIRILSRLHHYVVQCNPVIVDLYDKIYIIVWFWFFFLLFVIPINLLGWLLWIFIPPLHKHYIRKQLKSTDEQKQQSGMLSRFVGSYIDHDGLLALRLVSLNVGELNAAEITREMKHNFERKNQQQEKNLYEMTATRIQ